MNVQKRKKCKNCRHRRRLDLYIGNSKKCELCYTRCNKCNQRKLINHCSVDGLCPRCAKFPLDLICVECNLKKPSSHFKGSQLLAEMKVCNACNLMLCGVCRKLKLKSRFDYVQREKSVGAVCLDCKYKNLETYYHLTVGKILKESGGKESSGQCVVCFENPIDTVVIPCGIWLCVIRARSRYQVQNVQYVRQKVNLLSRHIKYR
eukprot:TRINITY_DN12043_c0_g1_i1.p1 TRINITY_DN12043_c0_g1~~TRINITY_DN12043_c0_g1_i1.p1  ORF type:complete len:221 (-),score=7.86 TRINITY_DN12043_c0_g1_i1:13-627(-)